ncbi:MAG: hypothetical protein Q8P81_03825, partial [Nanoarchaeota archaeon]|nr:hypothetical protein [Nanoarchaeota archaeon]
FLLTIVGFMVGSVFVSPTGILDYNFSSVSSEQPTGIFINYFGEVFGFYIKSTVYGVVGAILFALVGLILDFKRRNVYQPMNG